MGASRVSNEGETIQMDFHYLSQDLEPFSKELSAVYFDWEIIMKSLKRPYPKKNLELRSVVVWIRVGVYVWCLCFPRL